LSTTLRLKIHDTRTGVTLKVRLTPKSSRDEIVGVEDFAGEVVLKARVRAVPEAGRANASLVKLIAAWLKLPPSSVTVVQGGKSRVKHIAVEGDAGALARRIETRLATLAR